MYMSEVNNGYALITGASSGIGLELARLFAADGFDLILVSRQQDELNRIADEFSQQFGIRVEVIAKDLFGETSATEVYQEVQSRGLQVEVLVNDAGQGVYGKFIEADLEAQMRIIHLNVVSVTTLTYHFLKDMVARNSGKILQLGSVVSEIPAPLQAVYGGTKAYILSFSEAIRNELKDTNITVTVLQPGATDTDFFNKAGAQNSKMVEDKSKLSDPAKVAKDGYDALTSGDDKLVSV